MQTIWLAYIGVAVAASALFAAAGWRSRQVFHTSAGNLDLLDMPGAAADTAANQPLGDVAEAVHIALKRLMPVIASQSVRVDVAARKGLMVRMRAPALADLIEELLASVIHSAPASMLLLTAAARGDRVYISLSDDMPNADPAIRQSQVRNLAESVAMRGGALDINVRPDEGTTTTVRLAAAFEPLADADPDKADTLKSHMPLGANQLR